MPAKDNSAGFSLYELLMTMSLAAVILGIGLPSFGGLIADKRLRVETDALFHAVHRARQESIGRRRVVTICPSFDGRFCDPENRWSAGWIVFANKSRTGSGVRDRDETLVQHHQVADGVQIMSNRKSLSFRSTHLRATNGTLVVCDAAGRANPRALVVSYTGRPRVARADTRGRNYRCAR
jgi:type IV fimbrial biogenesis protein FimT